MAEAASSSTVLDTNLEGVNDFETLQSMVSTQSKVGVLRMILYVTSVGIWSLEKIFDAYRKEFNHNAYYTAPQTERWIVQETLKFQLGHDLEWDEDTTKYYYPTISEEDKIVNHAAVVAGTDSISIKVAGKDKDGPTKLSDSDVNAITSYWEYLSAPGSKIQVISEEPDALILNLQVLVDPLVFKSSGELQTQPGYPVKDAINNYIQNLPFNSVFWIDDLVDEIQKVNGVVAPDLKSIKAKFGNASYKDVDKYYLSYAGYMKLDEASTIEYIVHV